VEIATGIWCSDHTGSKLSTACRLSKLIDSNDMRIYCITFGVACISHQPGVGNRAVEMGTASSAAVVIRYPLVCRGRLDFDKVLSDVRVMLILCVRTLANDSDRVALTYGADGGCWGRS